MLAVTPSTERLTLNSEFQGALRRLKPEKHRIPLKPRPESELDFIQSTGSWTTKLLYDTTVYIDILQNRFPRRGEVMLRAAEAWHSPVTEAELAATCGLLDPAHAETRGIVEEIVALTPNTSRRFRSTRNTGFLTFPEYSGGYFFPCERLRNFFDKNLLQQRFLFTQCDFTNLW